MPRANRQNEETIGNVEDDFFSFCPVHIYDTYVFLILRRPLDEIEPRQVNARKCLVLDVPFFELFLRKPQMENLQAILHLEIPRQKRGLVHDTSQKKKQGE